jgi:CheY-like chemotaxis protein/anti-sigma regulatory factor (Ser/Thr protein kinase)
VHLADKKGLNFKVILENVPHEEFIGDPYRIRQILLNLLSNALKFTDTGSISLTLNEEICDEKTIHLIFIIRDTGCGIKQSSIERLFEEFEQADASVARVHGGSGLGLAIVKRLVDALHGTIVVSSHPDKGSQFTVTLPVLLSQNEEHSILSCESQTALIVDEEAESLRSLTHLCDMMHISSTSFTTAKNALAYVKDHPHEFSLCLLQRTLPDMTAHAFVAQIRKICLNAPLIFVMSNGLDGVQTQDNPSVSAYIQKPLFASDLYQLLSHTCLSDVPESVPTKTKRYDGCKILSVEDNKMNQLIITKILEMLGIEVFVASNGIEAVHFMKNNAEKDAIDLIFMDERMPLMDGITATKKIRALHIDIPIIALSANAFKKDVERSLQSGMNAHLAKPLDKKRLYEILETYLSPKV